MGIFFHPLIHFLENYFSGQRNPDFIVSHRTLLRWHRRSGEVDKQRYVIDVLLLIIFCWIVRSFITNCGPKRLYYSTKVSSNRSSGVCTIIFLSKLQINISNKQTKTNSTRNEAKVRPIKSWMWIPVRPSPNSPALSAGDQQKIIFLRTSSFPFWYY